jgi:hypothetical protein
MIFEDIKKTIFIRKILKNIRYIEVIAKRY